MKILVSFLRIMPHSFALSFGRFAGRLLRLILWKITDRCEARCVKSLGVGVTISRDIIRGSFVNLGMSAAYLVLMKSLTSIRIA